MKLILLTILGIGLLFVVVVIAVAAAIFKKGARFLFNGGRGHRHYTSSGGWKNPIRPGGHTSFGHGHYRRRHSSNSFFSS